MRLLLVVNTSASSVTARARVVIHKALSADHEVVMRETNRRGHAARLAQGAAADGLDAVVVLGGDGTMNEAANGLAGSATALAVLPGGSTNVFARTIGMANDPIEATSQLLSALAVGSVERVGLGRANSRYFLFHAGIGFDAVVVAGVEKLPSLKRYTGPVPFLAAALYTWANGYEHRHPPFSVSSDAGPVLDDGYFAVCLNTDPYTYLGNRPLQLAPGTSLVTPLSLVVLHRLTLRAVLPAVAAALGEGLRPQGGKYASVLRPVAQATVKGHGPVPYQLDGDYVGESERIELRWAAGVLSLVLPVGPDPGAVAGGRRRGPGPASHCP
jgi:diacylglycerol kinase family enzyme